MKRTRYVLFCLVLFQSITNGQDFSNKGKDFWLCFPTHVPSNQIAKMSLFLTSDQNSSGTITVGNFSTTFTVTANQVGSGIDIPYNTAHIAASEANAVIKNKGIHVQVDNGKPAVVLYAHIYASARSEASLILPTTVLGKKYFSMNYIQTSGNSSFGTPQPFQSQFNVMAVEANTSVKYQLRRNGVLDNTSTTVVLQDIGDILEIQASQDLTGSIIESVASGGGSTCKKIAVFSGSSAINIGSGNSAGTSTDPLFQQCYPVNTWGKSFGMVPFTTGTSPFHYRVLASEDNTTVDIDGTTVTLNAGQFYPTFPGTNQHQVAANKPFLIKANKPVSVAQYMISSNLNGYPAVSNQAQGDPEMVILNPIEQNISDISVFSSTQEVIRTQYLNVFTKFTNAASFKINGAAPKSAFVRLPAPNDEYAYLIENLTGYGTTSFRITADDGFNAICYGTGQVESYGYSAGTSLRDFTPRTTFQNAFARIDSSVTCVNSPFRFSVPISFIPSTIRWDFSAAPNITPNTNIGPSSTHTPDSMVTGSGGIVYYYSPGNSYTFTRTNTSVLRDTIKLYTTSAAPDGCGSTDQTFSIPVKVNEAPVADFIVAHSGCASDSVAFTDKSIYSAGSLIGGIWDFGDGTSLTTNSTALFTKKYANSGNYPVKLKAISDIGCASVETVKTLVITDKPIAKFNLPALLCSGSDISYTDASSTVGGSIVKWVWTLDDGNAAFTNTTSVAATTKYTTPGTKNVSLLVESNTGCKSDSYTQVVKINALPAVGFVVPEICLNDANAEFTDTSSIAEGTNVSYAWQFNAGTPAVSPGPSIASSTAKNPQLKYNKADNYKVSLRVTSDKGCVATLVQDFTVNGATPKAAFDMVTATPYCGTKAVQLKNNSTVDFGNVTRLEIYWDNSGAPTVKQTDETPSPGKLYAHSYPDPSSPKQYTVRMLAYSGGTSCVSETSRTITVYPQPKAAFTMSASQICSGAFVDFTDKSTTGSSTAKNWVWDLGKSSSSVQQNPSKQYNDSGLMNVAMYFYNTDGCISDTASKILTVYPNPQVTLTHKQVVLDGGVLSLKPTWVYGNNLTFLWTPAKWLNSDTAKQPVSTPQNDITYKLIVTGEGGCIATDTTFIRVLKGPEVPNAFSPNGDGVNDTWHINYLDGYPGATIDVYNRSGQIIFRSTGYDKEWDGSYQGKPLSVGTYYYIINPRNGRQVISGSVTIIK